jgi:Domain of unknown function (DUF4160)
VPTISRFYGITILMYAKDHPPPHFHARYAEHQAKFGVDGRLLSGSLPRRARQLVQTWAGLHREELEQCWNRASERKDPGTIEPLR